MIPFRLLARWGIKGIVFIILMFLVNLLLTGVGLVLGGLFSGFGIVILAVIIIVTGFVIEWVDRHVRI